MSAYIMMLEKKQVKATNAWLRLARKSADMSGYVRGATWGVSRLGAKVGMGVMGARLKSAHQAEVRASAISNQINHALYRLRATRRSV